MFVCMYYQFKFTGEKIKDGEFITLYKACLEMFVFTVPVSVSKGGQIYANFLG